MGFAYDASTPTKSPLGGTQSAVVYLSQALVALGHSVTVINGVESALESGGVAFAPLPYLTADMNAHDVIIAGSGAAGLTAALTVLSSSGAIMPVTSARSSR